MLLAGGTDKDGWQYAKDFPASYHPDPGFTDYVRRRRWSRRCHLLTTGPWVHSSAKTPLLAKDSSRCCAASWVVGCAVIWFRCSRLLDVLDGLGPSARA